jgi:hypothetical protein
VKSIALDPASPDDLTPVFTQSMSSFLLHWADTIYFEDFLSDVDPTQRGEQLKYEGVYKIEALVHRLFLVGTSPDDRAGVKAHESSVRDSVGNADDDGYVKLMADENDNVLIATALDHVAELSVDDSFSVMNLSIKDLRELLEEQKVGLSFMVGPDLGEGFFGAEGVQHHTVVWDHADALHMIDRAIAADASPDSSNKLPGGRVTPPARGDFGAYADADDDADAADEKPISASSKLSSPSSSSTPTPKASKVQSKRAARARKN